MVVTTRDKRANAKASEKTRSRQKRRTRNTGGRKRMTEFNKFVQTEVARLKQERPDMVHKDRFKKVIENWHRLKDTVY